MMHQSLQNLARKILIFGAPVTTPPLPFRAKFGTETEFGQMLFTDIF